MIGNRFFLYFSVGINGLKFRQRSKLTFTLKIKLKMKTYLLDIFPKLHRFSEKLDNLSLLTNQHWVYIDEVLSNKTVYIFRTNNELLISTNGKVEKAKWEYLGNKSILIDKISDSYLFKHGFFDENILALKVDSSEEYVLFVNENKYEGELNSIIKIYDFLTQKYLNPNTENYIEPKTREILNPSELETVYRETIDNDVLKIVSLKNITIGAKVYINEKKAPDGTYIYKSYTHKLIVENGIIVERYFLEKINDYFFEKQFKTEPTIGDKIFKLNGEKINDGKYKYSFLKSYYTENGIIVK